MYYVGLIDTENVGKFQKMVFRITRGKVLVKASDIGSIPNIFDHLGDKYRSLNPTDNQKAKSKSLLFMFLIGKDSQLGKRLKAIISVFDVFHVSLPPNDQEINKMLADSAKAQDEMTKIARKTVDEIQTILEYFVQLQDVGISRLDELKYLINREKMIYKAMAYLEQQNDLYSLKVWIDKEEQQTILEQLMHYCSTKSNMTKPIITLLKENARNKPPSKFDLNEFTAPFQQIVETYAIPKYKEINPAPFTAGTFPFLFGVMFGDACHGLIIFCLGIYLLLRSDDFSKRGGVYAALNSLRYMIALLGFFSFYNGIVYNDFASIPLVLFESCYHYVPESTGEGGQKIHAHYLKKPDCTYPFGIDWTWYEAGNDIPFMNSYKMKVAIILGVLQMLFGIILKGFNAFYFKSALDFICEVIPQFLFLGGLFGYMCVLIVFKWLTEWGDKPPQIISVFTSLTKVDEKLNVLGNQDLQQQIQTVILVTCMVSTLLMFFPKPIILAMRSKGDHKLTQNERKISSGTPKHKGSVGSDGLQFDTQTEDQLILDADEEHDATGRHQHSSRDSHSSSSSAAGGHEHEGFGELMVHQAIETIEFVLGSISNTASYLRLWALSLAHSQLSKVFLNLLMHSAYENAGNSVVAGVTIAIKFVSLATTTAGILLMMDAMECFLHTLRLHWVEFQSKFYKGEGLKYEPFSFKEENK